MTDLVKLAERLERIAVNLRSEQDYMVFIPTFDEAAAALRSAAQDEKILTQRSLDLAERNAVLWQRAEAAESRLASALRAACAGNTDDTEPVRCQSYEASEQNAPCPRGRCVMADDSRLAAAVKALQAAEPFISEFAIAGNKYAPEALKKIRAALGGEHGG